MKTVVIILFRVVIGCLSSEVPSSVTEFINVALNKPTQQSSTHDLADSSRAVDGNTNNNYHLGSCTHTSQWEKNWWVVDLMTSYPVHSVRITNRQGETTLQNFFVYVSKSNPVADQLWSSSIMPGKLCFKYNGIFDTYVPTLFMCDDVVIGRYVYVWKPGYNDKLCLCEVEVLVKRETLELESAIRTTSVSLRMDRKSIFTSFSMTTLKLKGSMDCVIFCLAANGGRATVVQLHSTTGLCECIEKSHLDPTHTDPTVSISRDIEKDGWILMESIYN